MVTRRTDRPISAPRARATRRRTPEPPAADGRAQRRGHQGLAPAHVGDAVGVTLLASATVALALLIVAVAIIVGGLTQASRFVGTPPPNLDEIGRGQVVGGLALLVASVAELILAVAILLDWRPARPLAAALNAVLAVAAAFGSLTVYRASPDPDLVVVVALAAVAVFFAAATIVLVTHLRKAAGEA